MPDILDIVAILSGPFRCEGSDGHDYFEKLKNVGSDCFVREWITGRLAHLTSLPGAEMRQVRVPPELAAGNRDCCSRNVEGAEGPLPSLGRAATRGGRATMLWVVEDLTLTVVPVDRGTHQFAKPGRWGRF